LAAIDMAGYKAGHDLFIALDPAASSFYRTLNMSSPGKVLPSVPQKWWTIMSS
jgi:enolase